MAARGVFLPPSQFEGLFLSTAHTDEDIEKTIAAVEATFKELQEEFSL
jgi:glutamate-1-semialdehyde 2,1-aminomutase